MASAIGWIDGNPGTPITLVNSGGAALSTPTLKTTDPLKLTHNGV